MARKQSQQEAQEVAAQSRKYQQAESDQWGHHSWIQAGAYQLKKSAMPVFKLAVQPQYQFLVLGVLHMVTGQFPILDKCMAAVTDSSGFFQSVLYKVLTLQAVQLLWSGGQLLNQIRKESKKIAITSQVVATRANMDEWRQCLQFASQWHQTTLQGAYLLWQSQSLSVPAPPANQWMKVASGQPMYPSDAALAGQTVSSTTLTQISVESRLTEYHEMAVHCESGVAQFSDHQMKLIQEVDQLYGQFMKDYTEFSNSSQTDRDAKLKSLASELDRVDMQWYMQQSTVPATSWKKTK